MKIALAQLKIANRMEDNLQKAVSCIQEAAGKGAELICFPEVQLTPFFPQYAAQPVGEYLLSMKHPYIQQVCNACRDNSIYAVPNFYIGEYGNAYDMSLLIDGQGEIIGKQKMVHIAQCPQFYEQDYYTPSEEGFQVFHTPIGCIGIVVCFDRHYPESIRTEALLGAELSGQGYLYYREIPDIRRGSRKCTRVIAFLLRRGHLLMHPRKRRCSPRTQDTCSGTAAYVSFGGTERFLRRPQKNGLYCR